MFLKYADISSGNSFLLICSIKSFHFHKNNNDRGYYKVNSVVVIIDGFDVL
jgi:hypothetical protein